MPAFNIDTKFAKRVSFIHREREKKGEWGRAGATYRYGVYHGGIFYAQVRDTARNLRFFVLPTSLAVVERLALLKRKNYYKLKVFYSNLFVSCQSQHPR